MSSRYCRATRRISRVGGFACVVRTLRWLPAVSRLVLGADDGSVTEWDVATAQRTRGYAPHSAAVTALALTTRRSGVEGAAAVSAGHDGTMAVWAWQPELRATDVVRGSLVPFDNDNKPDRQWHIYLPLAFTVVSESCEVAWMAVEPSRARLSMHVCDQLAQSAKLDLEFLESLPQLNVLSPEELGQLVGILEPRVIDHDELSVIVDSTGSPQENRSGFVNAFGQYFWVWRGRVVRRTCRGSSWPPYVPSW